MCFKHGICEGFFFPSFVKNNQKGAVYSFVVVVVALKKKEPQKN